jgi:hypothetical protein
VRSTVASTVPAAVAAVARGTDPYQRDAQTMGDALKARIPGLSRQVPEKVTTLGDPLPSTGGVLRQMFDLTRTSPNRETPVLAEMRRLGVSLSKPGKTIAVNGKTYALSPEEYRDLQRAVGVNVRRALEAAVVSDSYLRERETPERTDLAHRDRLEAGIRQARSRVQQEVARSIHQAEKDGTEHVGILRAKPRRF